MNTTKSIYGGWRPDRMGNKATRIGWVDSAITITPLRLAAALTEVLSTIHQILWITYTGSGSGVEKRQKKCGVCQSYQHKETEVHQCCISLA